MVKRKRDAVEEKSAVPNGKTRRVAEVTKPTPATHIHLITGSYERALHGIIATIPLSILNASNVAVSAAQTTKQKSEKTAKQPQKKDDPKTTKNGLDGAGGEGEMW